MKQYQNKIKLTNQGGKKQTDAQKAQPFPAEVVAEEATMVSPSSSTGDLAESEIEVEEDMNEILLAQQCMLLEGGLTNHLEEIHIYKATADPDTLYYHEAIYYHPHL